MRPPPAAERVGAMLRSTVHPAREALLAGLPIAERRVEFAGVSTALLEGGDGPPLVLLHGPGANTAHWLRVIPDLVAGHRVIAPDLPGHGASDPSDDLVAWLAAVVETCPTPPVVVGLAAGGALAARTAIEHGELIDRLVLVDMLGLTAFNPAPEFGAALQAFMGAPTADSHERLWSQCAFDLPRVRDELGDRWAPFEAYNLDRAATPSGMASVQALIEHYAFSPIEGLERLELPVALVWGRQDPATPLAVAEEASARYGWPLHVIESCGVDPHVEQPAALVRALEAEALRARLDGSLLLPAGPGFADATRLWNGMIVKTPALVVQPEGPADVVDALGFARTHGLAVSVRGGGHNIAGTALVDGGVTIDMSLLREVTVEPVKRTATVQPGCLLGDVDRAVQEHGLATPLGFVSEVGAAGLTLGGGLGYLTRRFGWTVDNLIEVEIVTADGRVRRASRDENEDLFWAVRGAGANMGVVTSFRYRLHEVGPTVFGGLIAWPFARAAEILRAYRTLTSEAPRELATWLILFRAPPAPFVPPEWHGERICAMPVCYSGDLAAAEQAIAPIRALGDPIFDLLGAQPYTQLQSYLDDTEPKGPHYYWRTEYLAELSDELLERCEALAGESPIPNAEVGFLHVGGALNEHEPDDGAVGNRDARYALGVIAGWEPGEPAEASYQQWVRDAGERVRPYSIGNYVNFQTADEGNARVRASYGANYERLAAIKRRYDPDNLFRSNRNVPPARE
jgi:FAD/FMN-containing dehydrogenase/pimeloyl-ACP methyl ester carboxylesterase